MHMHNIFTKGKRKYIYNFTPYTVTTFKKKKTWETGMGKYRSQRSSIVIITRSLPLCRIVTYVTRGTDVIQGLRITFCHAQVSELIFRPTSMA